MKKIVAMLLCALMLMSTSALCEAASPSVTALDTGEVQTYDFGENKLHAYVSGDALGDTCYAVETADAIVLIESTGFSANNALWKSYVDGLGKPIAGKLMAYHPNGSDAYSAELPYATENALTNWGEGGSVRALTDGFIESFGADAIESELPAEAQLVSFGDTVSIAGLDFIIRDEGDDAYGIEIPALNVVYIHMMGSACHNILTSIEHIDAFIAELQGFDYELVLTGHNAPEGRDAVATKIAYLEQIKAIAQASSDAETFIASVNEAFPDYAGANYLEMTAGYLFPAA